MGQTRQQCHYNTVLYKKSMRWKKQKFQECQGPLVLSCTAQEQAAASATLHNQHKGFSSLPQVSPRLLLATTSTTSDPQSGQTLCRTAPALTG